MAIKVNIVKYFIRHKYFLCFTLEFPLFNRLGIIVTLTAFVINLV